MTDDPDPAQQDEKAARAAAIAEAVAADNARRAAATAKVGPDGKPRDPGTTFSGRQRSSAAQIWCALFLAVIAAIYAGDTIKGLAERDGVRDCISEAAGADENVAYVAISACVDEARAGVLP